MLAATWFTLEGSISPQTAGRARLVWAATLVHLGGLVFAGGHGESEVDVDGDPNSHRQELNRGRP